MESASSLVEQILQRERQVVVAALVLVAASAGFFFHFKGPLLAVMRLSLPRFSGYLSDSFTLQSGPQ